MTIGADGPTTDGNASDETHEIRRVGAGAPPVELEVDPLSAVRSRHSGVSDQPVCLKRSFVRRCLPLFRAFRSLHHNPCPNQPFPNPLVESVVRPHVERCRSTSGNGSSSWCFVSPCL